jgi:hypothetical protein
MQQSLTRRKKVSEVLHFYWKDIQAEQTHPSPEDWKKPRARLKIKGNGTQHKSEEAQE